MLAALIDVTESALRRNNDRSAKHLRALYSFVAKAMADGVPKEQMYNHIHDPVGGFTIYSKLYTDKDVDEFLNENQELMDKL